VVEPLSMLNFPPANVWDAYILFLFVPMFLRVVLLVRPFIRVTKQLAPHGGWLIKRLKELPVKGFTLLAVNEILAFFIPLLLVLIFRLNSDPLGWDSWKETNWIGFFLILIMVTFWIMLDLLRIYRVRRMLKAVEKQNIERLKKVADAGMGIRAWIRKFGRRGKEEKEEEPVGKAVAKNALKTYGLLALKARKFTPAGLAGSIATGVAIEVARRGAGKVSDKIDEKMQEEFEKIAASNSNMLIMLFLRDLAMGVAPLLILWAVPSIFA